MARSSKWVEVPSPDVPLVQVARDALEGRLNLVWRYLQRASRHAASDTANVHQLRVSTRRTVAAIRIFEALLPERRKRWMLKRLKRVRRAAGDARDLDVMIARFRSPSATGQPDPRYAALADALRALRQQAQSPIDAIEKQSRHQRFPRRARALVKRVRLRGEKRQRKHPTFAEVGRETMHAQAREFFEHAEADMSEYLELHAFRIQGKQLRYALEIFGAAFGPALREHLYPRIVELQERLGRINDHATARERIAGWLAQESFDPALRPTLEQLRAEEELALAQSTQEFLAWWSASRRENLRRVFLEALEMDSSQLPSGTNHVA